MLSHEKFLIRELQRGIAKAFKLLYKQYHARLDLPHNKLYIY